MTNILDFIRNLPGIPMEYVLALIAFAVIALAGFSLHVIHSIVMRGKSK